jgi:hypothetical protein
VAQQHEVILDAALAKAPATRSQVLPVVQRLGMRVGLRFVGGVKGRTRQVRRLAGGVLSFADSPFPDQGRDEGNTGYDYPC